MRPIEDFSDAFRCARPAIFVLKRRKGAGQAENRLPL
jgi:hypothetical protein